MLNSNLQAFNLTVSTLLKNPSHLLPNLTIPTFLDLPEQLGAHLTHTSSSTSASTSASTTEKQPTEATAERQGNNKQVTIRALVLDKDNTLCPPNTTSLPRAYLHKLEQLRTSASSPFNKTQNPYGILIVSNTAGSRPNSSAYETEAVQLENKLQHLQIPVFRVQQGKKRKPFCGEEVLAYFKEKGAVRSADEIAVVGDRLGTDVLMAAQMGAWSVWCKDGVTHGIGDQSGNVNMDYRGFLAKVETAMERYLRETRGLKPRVPQN